MGGDIRDFVPDVIHDSIVTRLESERKFDL